MSEARRIRSPNYPALSLTEAIQRIKPVFERERQHSMPREVVLKGMGYAGANGAALGALSAAGKYGLLEKSGDSFRVTDRALAILHPSSPEEERQALRAAALEPPLFAELVEQFPGGQVSDDNLRSYLVRRDFSSSAVPGVIKAFRDTMQMVSFGLDKTLPSVVLAALEPAMPAGRGTMMHQLAVSNGGPRQPMGTDAGAPWLLSIDGRSLTIQARLDNADAVDKLITALEATKVLLPNAQAQSPAQVGDQETQ